MSGRLGLGGAEVTPWSDIGEAWTVCRRWNVGLRHARRMGPLVLLVEKVPDGKPSVSAGVWVKAGWDTIPGLGQEPRPSTLEAAKRAAEELGVAALAILGG